MKLVLVEKDWMNIKAMFDKPFECAGMTMNLNVFYQLYILCFSGNRNLFATS
ncbi:MAG: hypothetical protein WBM53_07305 [Maribacter sp.]